MLPKTMQRIKGSMSFPKWRRRCRSASEDAETRISDWKAHDRALLRRYRNGNSSSWLAVAAHSSASHASTQAVAEILESGYYDDPPLPSLLVAFKEHDAITACFDEEGQSMMEGTAEPTVCVVFFARANQMKSAVSAHCGSLIALNVSIWIDRGNSGELSCRRTVNRGEPSLRAA